MNLLPDRTLRKIEGELIYGTLYKDKNSPMNDTVLNVASTKDPGF